MKLKTRKSATKRIKSKKNGYARKSVNLAHFMSKKSSKRVRHLKSKQIIQHSDLSAFKLMLPYS